MPDQKDAGMTIIVKTVTRITLGFILLYGIYIALSGHVATGGGFAGGVIVALSLIHIMLAFGKEVALKRMHAYVMRFLVSIAALLFLAVVMVSFAGGCMPVNVIFGKLISCLTFNQEITVPLCEAVIVGAGLFAIFVALVLLSKRDRDSE